MPDVPPVHSAVAPCEPPGRHPGVAIALEFDVGLLDHLGVSQHGPVLSSLRRVLRNLADNAARHAGSTVVFTLEDRDGIVAVTVDDDGPGVPVAERERVLERFVRLDEGRARDEGGAGVGPAIVAGLVAACNAT